MLLIFVFVILWVTKIDMIIEKGIIKMSKHGNGVSSHTHTQQQINHYANQHNPNNAAHQANNNNHSNQLNPNNENYQGDKK